MNACLRTRRFSGYFAPTVSADSSDWPEIPIPFG
jgi:hypothetical protein